MNDKLDNYYYYMRLQYIVKQTRHKKINNQYYTNNNIFENSANNIDEYYRRYPKRARPKLTKPDQEVLLDQSLTLKARRRALRRGEVIVEAAYTRYTRYIRLQSRATTSSASRISPLRVSSRRASHLLLHYRLYIQYYFFSYQSLS